jgi:hypothetical protein
MATRQDLMDWVVDALRDNGGQASIVEIARHMWNHREDDLRGSGDLFFTWQYDMRCAAKRLRDQDTLRGPDATPRGIWALRR